MANGCALGSERPSRVEKPLLLSEEGPPEQAVSRILSWVTIRLGRPLPNASCDRNPGASDEQPSNAPLFGLAPGGACRAGLSPEPLVSSYLTVSPLPAPPKRPLAVCSLLRFPSGFPGWTLSSALLCGVRTFLDGGPRELRRDARRDPAAATWLAPSVYHPSPDTGRPPTAMGDDEPQPALRRPPVDISKEARRSGTQRPR